MPDTISSDVVDVYPFSIVDGRAQHLALLRTPGQALGNTWQTIHGRVQKRETAVQAAVREIVAQTGIHPVSLWTIDYINNFYSPEDDAIYLVPSIGALLPPDVPIELTPDHVNWEWVSPEVAVGRFLWAGERLALQTLYEEIAGPMAAGAQPNPYLQIAPSLYTPTKRGLR